MYKPIFIAGPCVIETFDILEEVAKELVRLNNKYGINIIFKSSFDKANRTSLHSYRGPNLEKGLTMLNDIKMKYGLSLLTDIHEPYQAEIVGGIVDVIQIPAFLCRQTDLLVAAARTGKIINISSVSGVTGNAGQANYSASKAGIIGLTKSAARELASRNINVNAIAPGFVDTDMTITLSDKVKEGAKGQIPLGRFGKPEEVAELALFLSSEKSDYITGQVINIDGGMVM